MKQQRLDIWNELIVDNFAGGGGASTGIEMALGRSPDIAINHDPEAVALHEANHPDTRHYVEDVFDIDPVEACGGRSVGLAWFSPDCKHFSKAKGGKPVDKKIRGLAWVVHRWASAVRPRVIILENVEEFETWGPLTPDNKPCPKRRGLTFRRWKKGLEGMGYRVEMRVLRACDYGAPTIRKRLFIIARCDGRPIVWPEPTHCDPKEAKARGLKPWPTAADCIDWSLPCPSIFERKRPLAENTMRRIARGIKRYVIDAEEPFIVNTRNGERGGQRPRVRGVDEPYWTVTSQGSQGALVTPYITEHANASNQRNMPADEPVRTQCAQVKGGHFALVSAFLTKFRTGSTGSAMSEPVHTITAGPKVRPAGAPHAMGIVTSHMVKLKGTCRDGQPTDTPMPTVQAGGLHIAEVRALLFKYYGNEEGGIDITDPMHTIPTKDRFGLVMVKGVLHRIVDIGMRMLAPHELYKAQGFPESYRIDIEFNGKPLSKSAQVRMCGNSVVPMLAKALVEANCIELAQVKAA